MSKSHRCEWLNENNSKYVDYHDKEWGVPVYNDRKLFEMLILEGAQAGLSWETILNKRANYRTVFFQFDIAKCSEISRETELEAANNAGIVRNKLKIAAVRINATVFSGIQKSHGSFSAFLWDYVDGKPLQPCYKNITDIPVTSDLSEKISKDLKAKGMKFVGPTIIQAYMQAIGMINAHTTHCFRHSELSALKKR